MVIAITILCLMIPSFAGVIKNENDNSLETKVNMTNDLSDESKFEQKSNPINNTNFLHRL